MARLPPFALQSYRHRDLPVSAQRCLNFMSEQQPKDARSPLVLMPTPGLTRFSMLATGPVRGCRVMGSYLYVVAGIGVYRVDVAGASLLLGNIADGGPVTMAENSGGQMGIVCPDTAQMWVATTTTLVQVTDTDFEGASSLTVVDGYGVVTVPNSGKFRISALNDLTSWAALDFATAEANPDNLTVARRVGRELWLFGETTTEIWSNTGASDFPFQRISGAFLERGIIARDSLSARGPVPFWLGDDKCVYQGNGAGDPQRISTHAIEQAIAGYPTVSDARGMFYEQEGHAFYVLTFPTGGATWVYDRATQVWHERESEGYGLWRCVTLAAFGGAVIGGDAVDGRLYVVDPTATTEDGAAIIRVADGMQLANSGKRMFHRSLTVDVTTGIGATSGQGSAPLAMLAWSDDGGRSFSQWRTAPLGALGNYNARVKFDRLGSSRQRVYRFQISDPVRATISAVDLDAVPAAA